MLASKLILKCLELEGVDTIFGYPGGALLPLYNALIDSDIAHVLVRNEQAAPHCASGYAREKGTVGVCMATSGPGATNLITGIATAYMDSIPIVAITGQVNRALIGTDAFQEADITGATQPFTKRSYLVTDAKELPRIFKEAFHIARTGRPGPVLIDIPKDVQEENVRTYDFDKPVHIVGYKPNYEGHSGQIKKAIREIKSAKRPVIYAGGGIVLSKAQEELIAFAEKNKIPVITTLMGVGCFPQTHPMYCGVIGSHGYQYTSEIMEKADLCFCIGARMSDRGTTPSKELIDDMILVHIDIDPAEIGKNVYKTNIPIVGDAKIVLGQLLEKEIGLKTEQWLEEIQEIKERIPVDYSENIPYVGVNPKLVFKTLSELSKDKTTLVADVGLNQFWASLYFTIYGERKYFTSGGLGTMGYSVPAAIGAYLAKEDADRQIVAVCGDGSFQMFVGELAVIGEQKMNIKIIMIRNRKLGMVRQLQKRFYGKTGYFGTDINFDIHFDKIAEAYELEYYSIDSDGVIEEQLTKVLASDQSCLVECVVDEDFLYI